MSGRRSSCPDRAGQIHLYVPDFLGVRPCLCARSGTQKRKQKKNGRTKSNSMGMSDRKKLETIIFVLCDLHRACSFHFYCNSIRNFSNETFAVLMLFECLKKDAHQRITFFLQTHLSKCLQRNMLKAWNFTKYKFCNRSFDNSLHEYFGK